MQVICRDRLVATYVVLVMIFKSEFVVPVNYFVTFADHRHDVLEPGGVKGAV